LVAAALTLSGCISSGLAPERPAIAASELVEGADLPFHRVDPPVPEMLALTPAMESFVDDLVASKQSPLERWEALVEAITSATALDLVYTEATVTASDAFALGEGNCLSYSAMLIALARRAGLDARFREVDVPPDWSHRDGVLIRWNHINVLLDLDQYGSRILDFGVAGDMSGYPGTTVADTRALAHFVNNLGVEHMERGDQATALGYFRNATGLDSSFSLPWDNIGAIYSRQGLFRHAEASYLHALEIDDEDLTAMHNLVRLYDRQGNVESKALYETRVARYRDRNPFYHYGLALQAFEAGDLSAAERHLREAMRRRPGEERFEALDGDIRERRAAAPAAARQASLTLPFVRD
jgi:tetratricopeptide (TPR) repeat protein